MPFFLSWLSGYTPSRPTRCAQRAHPLRKCGPKTVHKLLQPKSLCPLPLYLGELGGAPQHIVPAGPRPTAKARFQQVLSKQEIRGKLASMHKTAPEGELVS